MKVGWVEPGIIGKKIRCESLADAIHAMHGHEHHVMCNMVGGILEMLIAKGVLTEDDALDIINKNGGVAFHKVS